MTAKGHVARPAAIDRRRAAGFPENESRNSLVFDVSAPQCDYLAKRSFFQTFSAKKR
jgi:hypothetical protein